MRQITSHKVNGLNDSLEIQAMDEPGSGGACHHYGIYGWHSKGNPSATPGIDDETKCTVLFQNGPIGEAGVNGISNEVLLAIVEDRLKSFQAGPFACRENALALTHLQESMHWLHHRTRERMTRGVEGTLSK